MNRRLRLYGTYEAESVRGRMMEPMRQVNGGFDLRRQHYFLYQRAVALAASNERVPLPSRNLRRIFAVTYPRNRFAQARDSDAERPPQLLGNHRMDFSLIVQHPPSLDARPIQAKAERSLRIQDRMVGTFGGGACPPFPWQFPSARARTRS